MNKCLFNTGFIQKLCKLFNYKKRVSTGIKKRVSTGNFNNFSFVKRFLNKSKHRCTNCMTDSGNDYEAVVIFEELNSRATILINPFFFIQLCLHFSILFFDNFCNSSKKSHVHKINVRHFCAKEVNAIA